MSAAEQTDRIGYCHPSQGGCGATFEYAVVEGELDPESEGVDAIDDCPECGNGTWCTVERGSVGGGGDE